MKYTSVFWSVINAIGLLLFLITYILFTSKAITVDIYSTLNYISFFCWVLSTGTWMRYAYRHVWGVIPLKKSKKDKEEESDISKVL